MAEPQLKHVSLDGVTFAICVQRDDNGRLITATAHVVKDEKVILNGDT